MNNNELMQILYEDGKVIDLSISQDDCSSIKRLLPKAYSINSKEYIEILEIFKKFNIEIKNIREIVFTEGDENG